MQWMRQEATLSRLTTSSDKGRRRTERDEANKP
jgi:hypothetical protein